jgi:hypothetical protein
VCAMQSYTCEHYKKNVYTSLVDAPKVSAFDSAALSAADIASSCYWYNIMSQHISGKVSMSTP